MEGPDCGEPLPPDLRELESKVGRRPPEGLVRWLREDPAAALLRESPARGQRRGLAGKIKALKLELAYLRAIDVQILQQLVVVNEGIEAVKWLLEEKGTLTSHCSSLASSQYSLVESQETSRRGSCTSLQDPAEKLDSISVGSYLDTLADEMDEYSHGATEPVLSSTPGRPGIPPARLEQDWSRSDPHRGLPSQPGSPQDNRKAEQEWLRMDRSSARPAQEQSARDPARAATQPQVANGFLGRQAPALEASQEAQGERLSRGSPARTAWRNGQVDVEPCKLNGKLHLEYDAHWRWVQSQDDVTFL
ncbi:leucine rich adaptor protein 1 [Mauremys mutica]|uniref:leucine rich adaptor protein 1 n=1 Tax=Mauremys mutica TaxID=74926 RepID=UPI001D1623E3|nr:leucine rich adaptor protein 1 [Mauremys mutica]